MIKKAENKSMSLEDKLFLVKTKKFKETHISIDQSKCEACADKVCKIICPAGTYEEIDGSMEALYENCLECGSCKVACSKDAIDWENPAGGYGITFHNG